MPARTITQAQVQHELRYDFETGEFWWRRPRPGRQFFVRADKPHVKGYRTIFLDGKFWMAHTVAWLYVHGELLVKELDHKDRCRDNNRITNLRKATAGQNNINRITNSPKSGYQGVAWSHSSQKWMARIKKDGRTYYLGIFSTPELAHKAYLRAVENLFGNFLPEKEPAQ